VIYAHGGGYALGSPEVAVPITERLAAAGLEVISVDYRLAPEHPYPAGLDDVDAVYRAVTSTDGIRRRGGRATVIVAGDSAGANLALGVVLRSIVSGTPRPIGLVLFSPHLDHALTRLEAPVSRHPRDDVDDRSAAWLRAAYIGHRSPADPGVSPLRADLAGLCPILIQVGSEDIARPHGEALSRRARAAGVEVTLEVWPGLWHTWHYHRGLPEADEALARAARWIGALAPDRGGP
jgi:acetyl esterase/lipase